MLKIDSKKTHTHKYRSINNMKVYDSIKVGSLEFTVVIYIIIEQYLYFKYINCCFIDLLRPLFFIKKKMYLLKETIH